MGRRRPLGAQVLGGGRVSACLGRGAAARADVNRPPPPGERKRHDGKKRGNQRATTTTTTPTRSRLSHLVLAARREPEVVRLAFLLVVAAARPHLRARAAAAPPRTGWGGGTRITITRPTRRALVRSRRTRSLAWSRSPAVVLAPARAPASDGSAFPPERAVGDSFERVCREDGGRRRAPASRRPRTVVPPRAMGRVHRVVQGRPMLLMRHVLTRYVTIRHEGSDLNCPAVWEPVGLAPRAAR